MDGPQVIVPTEDFLAEFLPEAFGHNPSIGTPAVEDMRGLEGQDDSERLGLLVSPYTFCDIGRVYLIVGTGSGDRLISSRARSRVVATYTCTVHQAPPKG